MDLKLHHLKQPLPKPLLHCRRVRKTHRQCCRSVRTPSHVVCAASAPLEPQGKSRESSHGMTNHTRQLAHFILPIRYIFSQSVATVLRNTRMRYQWRHWGWCHPGQQLMGVTFFSAKKSYDLIFSHRL